MDNRISGVLACMPVIPEKLADFLAVCDWYRRVTSILQVFCIILDHIELNPLS